MRLINILLILTLCAHTTRAAVSPVDCADATAALPIQTSGNAPNTLVRTLNVVTGAYTELASHSPFPYSAHGNTGLGSVNGVGISPIDNKAYGLVRGTGPTATYFMRWDNDEIEFLCKVWQGTKMLMAGTFTSTGDFWIAKGRDMYKITAAQIAGWDSSAGNPPPVLITYISVATRHHSDNLKLVRCASN